MVTRAGRNRSPRDDARSIFLHAVRAVSPYKSVLSHLKVLPSGILRAGKKRYNLNRYERIFVVGGGKAVCAMAEAVESVLGARITDGVVVTAYGHSSAELSRIKVVEAGHPVPDGNGVRGAKEVLRVADRAGRRDLVISLISGGASALLAAPARGIRLGDLKRITALLLKSGADIHEINAVRKHLSRIKGGLLARRVYPADLLSLIMSDVVGDDPGTIASGPTSPDPTVFEDCLGVLRRYGLLERAPRAVVERFRKAGACEETPKPGDPCLRNVNNVFVATNLDALKAAKVKARSLGYRTVVLTSTMSGPARRAAAFFSSIVKEVKKSGNPLGPPACIIAGGETTVKVLGRGKGGRNQEFALAAAVEIAGQSGVTLLAAGTDGIDGPTDAAGALADASTADRAFSMGLDPMNHLERNDSYTFFDHLGDLLRTGPTGTNVMDMVVALVV